MLTKENNGVWKVKETRVLPVLSAIMLMKVVHTEEMEVLDNGFQEDII